MQFVRYYGTHYITTATLGGLGVMKTTLAQSYYSTTSDSSIQADLEAAWGSFGASASGSSSSHTASAKFMSNAAIETQAVGGDPAISQFTDRLSWKAWAESVKTGAPVTMSYRLGSLSQLIKDQYPSAQKHLNVNRSVYE